MSDEIKIEPTSRQVIENKLLTALQEDGVVAVLLNEYDLDTLIISLKLSERDRMSMGRQRELREGFEKLKESAFK